MWACPTCHGRAIGIGLLRRSSQWAWFKEFWARASEASIEASKCPSCRQAMVVVEGDVAAELCRRCQLSWIESADYESVPVLHERRLQRLPQEALERLGRVEAERIAADYNRRFGQQISAADALPLVPGLAGLPLEAEQRTLTRNPWVTWGLTFVLFFIGLWSLVEPDSARGFGVVATEIDRLSGATLITAMFVHAAVFQFATNLYFLLIFGDNVEDHLGGATFALLLFVGGFAGNLLHALLGAGTSQVLMGASGAVSAVVVFYACLFPNAQLRYIRLTRWHTMPAVAGLLFWLLTKLVSTQGFFGRAEPSVWPYVGGLVTGAAFWWFLRQR